MKRLDPADLPQFSRQFKFAGGRLRRVRVRTAGKGETEVELIVSARTAIKDLGTEPKPVRLRVRLTGVSEYRFQKRPGGPAGRVPDARFGYFDGQFFVTLDAYGLEPGERPGVHDFRASDAYAACQDVRWEVIEKKPNG